MDFTSSALSTDQSKFWSGRFRSALYIAMLSELLANEPLSPPAPEDLCFSEEQKTWIVSRHRDVLAALRSPDLSQTGPPMAADGRTVKPDGENTYSEVFNAFLNTRASNWQIEINGLASALLQPLIRDHPLDLVTQFIRPWCLASAVALIGIDPCHSERLAHLVACLSESDAAPHDAAQKVQAKEASRELDSLFMSLSYPRGKSMLLGIAQTLPMFLASAWAALFQHPSEWRKLRAHPDWMPVATEELLRYAGPVHSLFRYATSETKIAGTRIQAGDRLVLRLASANRDPQLFARPDLLDIKRRTGGHLALSSGSHYCVGASLVRLITSTAAQAMLTRYTRPELSESHRMVLWNDVGLAFFAVGIAW